MNALEVFTVNSSSEFAIFFLRHNSKQNKKVFQISQSSYKEKFKTIKKSYSFKKISTRKYYQWRNISRKRVYAFLATREATLIFSPLRLISSFSS